MRIAFLCTLGALGCASAAHATPAFPQPGAILNEAAKAADKGDCATAIKLARPIADKPEATGLNEAGAALALEIVARCDYQTGRTELALDEARRLTALDAARDEAWRFRLAVELREKRWGSAVETVEAMTQGRERVLNAVPQSWLWSLYREVKDQALQPSRLRLLKALSDPKYAPAEPLASADGFRLDYAGLLADQGRADEAQAIVRDLKGSYELRRASLDPRFRMVFPADFDIRDAVEAELAEARRAIALHPELLDPILQASRNLVELGHAAESLELLMSVAPRVDTPGAFRDIDKLNWYHDALGWTYVALARYDDAVASFRAGAALREGRSPNVSQLINLAHAQLAFGHGDEALRTLAAFDDPARKGSPYGESELRLARGCARAVAGRPAEASADLSYLRAHEKDHPEALFDLLLCLGDMDGAAKAVVARLADPERRVDALLQLSEYDAPEADRPAHPFIAKLPELKGRPDVQAAIASAGGIRRFHVQRSNL